jgi:hypothetical protein
MRELGFFWLGGGVGVVVEGWEGGVGWDGIGWDGIGEDK